MDAKTSKIISIGRSFGAGGKTAMQIELADGAAGALETGPVAAQHQRGLVELFHQAGSHDADDALIPVRPRDDQRRSVQLVLGLRQRLFGDALDRKSATAATSFASRVQ